jgi:DNA-binding LacI/PurR family transcriptional regulator
MPHSRPTIRDVAREAGVSHQTVSRVINQSETVLPETRVRVQEAIEALGFRPSAIARSMAQGRTSTLACIAPNLTDFTFASIIEGAEHKARQLGYFLLSSSAEDPEAFHTLVDQLVGHSRVDGLLVINPYADERYKFISSNFPVVFVGARARKGGNDSVSLDDHKAAYDATRHLIELGHRNIAHISGPIEEDCSTDRSNGYLRAMEEAGLPVDPSTIINGDWSATSGRDALFHLADQGQLPTAVFAQNDRMALGVLSAAREIGVKVPAQLAVIGIDDMPLSSYFDPPLTTMHQDMPLIGQEAARMLIRSIDHPSKRHRHIKLSAQLVVRQSTFSKGGT